MRGRFVFSASSPALLSYAVPGSAVPGLDASSTVKVEGQLVDEEEELDVETIVELEAVVGVEVEALEGLEVELEDEVLVMEEVVELEVVIKVEEGATVDVVDIVV